MNYNVSRWSIVIIDGACVLSHGLMRFHHPNPIYPRMIQSSIWTRYPPVILYLCFHVGIDLRTQGTKYCLFYLFFHDDDTIDICIFSSSVWCPIGGRCSQVRGLRSKLNDGCYRSNSRGDKDKSTRLNVLYKWWKYWNGSQLSSGWAEQDWVVGCYRECRLSVNVREQRPKEVQRQQEKKSFALVFHWDSAVYDTHAFVHSYHNQLRHPLYLTWLIHQRTHVPICCEKWMGVG